MRSLGIAYVALALIIGVVPMFSDCQSQGHVITLASGKTIPMACHWTGRAELAVALPLLATGVFTAISRRRETLRFLAMVGVVAGVAAILLPTALIGVCHNPDMICNMVMKPTLIFAGILTVAVGAVALLRVRREADLGLLAEEGAGLPL